jgi:hypothetical protein
MNPYLLTSSSSAEDYRKFSENPLDLQFSKYLAPILEFEKLVITVGRTTREGKSNGPREILQKLSLNSKLLYYEVNTIKIQSIIRRFLATRRVQRIRHHLKLFLEVTQQLMTSWVEETVLGTCLEISITYMKLNRRYLIMKQLVANEINFLCDEFLRSIVVMCAKEIVEEIMLEVNENIIERRYVLVV